MRIARLVKNYLQFSFPQNEQSPHQWALFSCSEPHLPIVERVEIFECNYRPHGDNSRLLHWHEL